MVNINPLKYTIFLDIDFEKLSFNGYVQIKFDINQDNKENNIYLDCVKLDIKSVDLNNKNTKFKIENNKLIISINNNIFLKKKNIIIIKYSGKVSTDLFGIYYSKHNDSKIISTQFEPDGARRMFPCIDDPKFKSIFKIKNKPI